MVRASRFCLAAMALAFCLLPMVGRAGEISVFAAASLSEGLSDIAERFQADSGHEVTLTFAGSSALARQVAYGAPADVFISANADWMTHLENAVGLELALEKPFLSNRLVLIVPAELAGERQGLAELDLAALLAGERLAMALVEAVPAGIYGRQAFENMGVWHEVSGQVAQVDNVRAALSLVALGAAAAGVVYETDAIAEARVKILAVFPPELHDPIVYPAAILPGKGTPEVLEFMSFLRSNDAREIFEARGFQMLEERE